jgi:hypothetical protein
MRFKGYLIATFLWLAIFHATNTPAAEPEAAEAEIRERIIEIKGTLEKPRVIFIIPKARLRKEERMVEERLKKSFISDILKPVYPESLIKEEGFATPARR